MKSVSRSAECLHEGRTAFEIPATPGRAMSMLEMFEKNQKLRKTQIHAARMVRLLLDIPFCEACIEFQRVVIDSVSVEST
jgi:hypothetical protein